MKGKGKKKEKKKGKSGKKKGDGKTIAAALMPTASTIAVPSTSPPPNAQPEPKTGLSSTVLSTSLLGRMFSTTSNDNPPSDTDTSLVDYLDHTKNRFSASGTMGGRDSLRYPTEESGRYSDRELHSPTDDYSSPRFSSMSLRSRRHSPERDEYMTRTASEPLGASLSRSARDGSPFQRDGSPRSARFSRSPTPRGTITPEIQERVEQMMVGSQSLVPPSEGSLRRSADLSHTMSPKLQTLQNQNQQLLSRQAELEEQFNTQRKLQDQIMQKLKDQGLLSSRKPDETLDGAMESLLQETQSVTDQTLKKDTELIKSLRDRTTVLETEKKELEQLNEQLQGELDAVQRLGSARDDSVEGQLRNRYKEECETLKSAVHRLSVELSIYQTKYRPINTDNSELGGLPGKGPIPSWLINTKYLAPLFLAYDDHLSEKEQIIQICETELDELQRDAEEIVKENQRLHIRIEQQENGAGPISMTEWKQLQEQSKLVLEENHLLLQQVELQRKKTKEREKEHIQETSKVSKELIRIEAEKLDVTKEIQEVKERYTEIKRKYDSLLSETQSRVGVEEHANLLSKVKESYEDEKAKQLHEIENLKTKLASIDAQKKVADIDAEDWKAEKKQMELDMKGLRKTHRKMNKKILLLELALQEAESQSQNASHYLNNVVKVAEKTLQERDTLAQAAYQQERQTKKAMSRLVEGNLAVGRMEEKLKSMKYKTAEKLDKALKRMKEQNSDFSGQKDEYEREIKHLRYILREREDMMELLAGDKRQIEDDLEVMWKAATEDNKKLRENMKKTLKKLSDHPNLGVALKDEYNPEEFLHISDSEY